MISTQKKHPGFDMEHSRQWRSTDEETVRCPYAFVFTSCLTDLLQQWNCWPQNLGMSLRGNRDEYKATDCLISLDRLLSQQWGGNNRWQKVLLQESGSRSGSATSFETHGKSLGFSVPWFLQLQNRKIMDNEIRQNGFYCWDTSCWLQARGQKPYFQFF